MAYDLVDRLGGFGDETLERLNPQAFVSCLVELAQGEITKAQIVAFHQLDASAETQLDWLVTQYNAQANATAKSAFLVQLAHIMWLARDNFPGYNSNAEIAARINRI